MRSAQHTVRVPATIALDLHPMLEPNSEFGQRLEDLRTRRSESDSCTLEGCVANREAISEEFRKRFLSGDRRAIARLLQINRFFVNEPWVREALQRDETFRDVVGPQGGRPVGRSDSAAGRGLALVAHVNALREATELSLQQIFERLGDGRTSLSSGRIRDLYYETIRNKRSRSILFETGNSA